MKLINLEPQFIQYRRENVDPDAWIDGVKHTNGVKVTLVPVDKLEDAHGIKFLCPICLNDSHHSVICWFEDKVPEEVQPGPGRWNPVGTGYHDLSFVPGKKTHSVLLLAGCKWHGFVTNGEVA